MKRSALFFISLFTLTACATQKNVERDIEQKAAHSSVSTSAALGGTIHDLIESSKTLTPAQKQGLKKILDANRLKAEELSQKSYQFRAVLIQELLSGNVDQKRIKIIKKDIKRIEGQRLKNTFDTVEKISAIVSKHPENHKFTEHLINIEKK